MLHVTIKDTKTNEVIFDREVCTIAVQAVDREKISRVWRTSEDAEPMDPLFCAKAVIEGALEAKKYFQAHSSGV